MTFLPKFCYNDGNDTGTAIFGCPLFIGVLNLIGCTKLLCGTATVSEALHHQRDSRLLPPNMLQFSADNRPVVVWNVTNRCNLQCRHCYIDAQDRQYSGELSTAEAMAFIDDLATLPVPVLLLSGGEPLLREDIYALAAHAAAQGIRPVLSTNGTLITPEVATRLREAGLQYVGVSLDGDETVHDYFRGRQGAFAAALAGLEKAREAGLKTGIRFTVNRHNLATLPAVLELAAARGIPRFCLYHLVYAGRGRDMAAQDITLEEKRAVMDLLIQKAQEFKARGVDIEILTTDNHADGIHLLHYIEQTAPARAAEVKRLLAMHGGCSAGQKMANVDPLGNVHACQFWGHKILGNVRQEKFSRIWLHTSDAWLAALRDKAAHLTGRCGSCRYQAYCGGCRIRAEAVHGDIWAEDPACYLTDAEIRGEERC